MKTVTTTKVVIFTKDFQEPYSVPAGIEITLSDKVADKLVKLGLAVVVALPPKVSNKKSFKHVDSIEIDN